MMKPGPKLSRRLFCSISTQSKKTALYDFHVANGGKMVDFAGWMLPVQYNNFGIIDSCLHTRSKASLFDVSHMGQLEILGKDREAFVEFVTVGDVHALKSGESRLSLITNESGGIIDDTIITKRDESVQMVLNAACVEKDMEHLIQQRERFHGDVSFVLHTQRSLVALQGPDSMDILQPLVSSVDLSAVPFMVNVEGTLAGVAGCFISRSGYTGEDGFEISIPNDEGATLIADTLLKHPDVRLAGLGARDTLRIEAGLCLYGSDISDSISPIEAGLGWTISKRRRAEGGFPGYDTIMHHIRNGVSRKRVGLVISNGPPARHDNELFSQSDNTSSIGRTTSGTFSPSLGKAVAMGYVERPHNSSGIQIRVDVRGKKYSANITKMPFIKPNYYRIS